MSTPTLSSTGLAWLSGALLFAAIGGDGLAAEPPVEEGSPTEETSTATVRIEHTPIASARRDRDLHVTVRIAADWDVALAWVSYRAAGTDDDYAEAELRRGLGTDYVAILPRAALNAPAIEYFISTRDLGGVVRSHFGSAERPHVVAVLRDEADHQLVGSLARHAGFASDLTLSGSVTTFAPHALSGGRETLDTTLMWSTGAEFRHRLYRPVYDIHFAIEIMRGEFDRVVDDDGETVNLCAASSFRSSTSRRCQRRPGVNLGRAGITHQFHRFFSTELDITLGATHAGFVAGAGTLWRIGEIEGTRFEVGGDYVGSIGGRGSFRFWWDTVPSVPMALGFQFTQWPAGNDGGSMGSLLHYRAVWEASARWAVGLDIGLALRERARSAMPSGAVVLRTRF